MREDELQKSKYFLLRGISANTYKDARLPAWIKNELTNPNLKILDYGCGFGQTLIALRRENFHHIFGIDIEATAIQHCKSSDLNVAEIDPAHLQNPFGFKFDVILLNHIIEHISKDKIIATLAFIRNDLLAANGKILLSVPNAQSNTGCYWAYEDWTHTTLFTSGSLFYVLRAAGFEKVNFLDIDCSAGKGFISWLRKPLLALYRANHYFWNKVTCSYYHEPSPKIFSYEIKAMAR